MSFAFEMCLNYKYKNIWSVAERRSICVRFVCAWAGSLCARNFQHDKKCRLGQKLINYTRFFIVIGIEMRPRTTNRSQYHLLIFNRAIYYDFFHLSLSLSLPSCIYIYVYRKMNYHVCQSDHFIFIYMYLRVSFYVWRFYFSLSVDLMHISFFWIYAQSSYTHARAHIDFCLLRILKSWPYYSYPPIHFVCSWYSSLTNSIKSNQSFSLFWLNHTHTHTHILVAISLKCIERMNARVMYVIWNFLNAIYIVNHHTSCINFPNRLIGAEKKNCKEYSTKLNDRKNQFYWMNIKREKNEIDR